MKFTSIKYVFFMICALTENSNSLTALFIATGLNLFFLDTTLTEL